MFGKLETPEGDKLVHIIICINCGIKKYAVPIAKETSELWMWEYIEKCAHCCEEPNYVWVLDG